MSICFLEKARKIKWLLEHEINPVTRDVQQSCYYCRPGYYRFLGDTQDFDISTSEFREVGRYSVRVWVCDNCGNTQLFRADNRNERRDW